MKTIATSLCLVLALGCITNVVSERVTFWSDVNFNGEEYHIEMVHGQCYKLGISNDRMSSMDTHGACVNLYTREDCFGGTFRLEPGSSCHQNFGDCDMNDRISSVRLCGGNCNNGCNGCNCNNCNCNNQSGGGGNNNNNNYNYK